MCDRFEVAAALREIGALLTLHGEQGYKARAYAKGADAIEKVERFDVLVRERRLRSIPGIGQSLESVITEWCDEGRSSLLDRLREGLPLGALELAETAGLTLLRIRALREALGIESVDALLAACEAGRVRSVEGFGAKTEARIVETIRRARARGHRVRLVDARALADEIVAFLRADPSVVRAEVAGDIRRWVEVVERIDVMASSTRAQSAVNRFARFPRFTSVTHVDDARAEALLSDGTPVVLHACEPERFGTEWVRSTGSPAHVAMLGALPDAHDEDAVYAARECRWIPPELRDGFDEFARARDGSIERLLRREDVRGLVHCHTTHSDGRDTIEAMARAADALGMAYLTITDHSPTAAYARGVTIDRLRAQWDEIASVQEHVKVRLLRGTESDILADGTLDYPDEILEQFDVVIASVHNRFKMDAASMTRRVIAAMQHPCFKIWGHALGRHLLDRPPFDCDVERILDAIADARAAIEINGDPFRLDLAPRWVREARARKIPLVISTDAHSVRDYEHLEFGVAMARRAGVERGEVLNTLPVASFVRAVRPARAD